MKLMKEQIVEAKAARAFLFCTYEFICETEKNLTSLERNWYLGKFNSQ